MADKELKTYRVRNRFRDGVATEEAGRPVYQDKGALVKLDDARAERLAGRGLIEAKALTEAEVKEAEAAAKAARAAADKAAAAGDDTVSEVAPRESTGATDGDPTTATGDGKKTRR